MKEHLLEYVKWRGDLTFMESSFNEIDAMVLAQLSSNDFTGAMPGAEHVQTLTKGKVKTCPNMNEVAKKYKELYVSVSSIRELLHKERLLFAAARSKRFGNIRMDGFIRDTDIVGEKQFSALTYYIPRGLKTDVFIAFRGTDGSVTSWKENFNMLYMMPVPAQADAVHYLDIMGQQQKGIFDKLLFGDLFVAGHSKGGNMALYASVYCNEKIQDKIKSVYCFDAPGYMKDLSAMAEYKRVSDKIRSYKPESTVIGQMMKVPYQSVLVVSDAKGLSQHAMQSWIFQGTEIQTVDRRSEYSLYMEEAIENTFSKLSEDELPNFVKEFFMVLEKNNITDIADFTKIDVRRVLGLIRGATSMSSKNRTIAVNFLKDLWDAGHKK